MSVRRKEVMTGRSRDSDVGEIVRCAEKEDSAEIKASAMSVTNQDAALRGLFPMARPNQERRE